MLVIITSTGQRQQRLFIAQRCLYLGELDKMVNLEHAKKFANSVKDSCTHVIHGSGHMIMIEKAFEMREKILEFIKK